MMIALKLPLRITGQAVISTLLVHQSLKILCQDQLTRLEIHINIIIPYVKQRHVVSPFFWHSCMFMSNSKSVEYTIAFYVYV